MKFSKEDQNTFLMVITILVVCLITIIVILNIVWGLLQKPVKETTDYLSKLVQTSQPLNYNFEVPRTAQTPLVEEPVQTEPDEPTTSIKYDLPYRPGRILGAQIDKTRVAILNDAVKAKLLTGNTLSQILFRVSIPSIGQEAPAIHGQNATEILSNGYYIYPGSHILEDGEIILLCMREQFASDDPRSCWYLAKLQLDDKIIIKLPDQEVSYKIIGKNVLEVPYDYIFNPSTDGNFLKIVTNTDNPNERLVLLAERE